MTEREAQRLQARRTILNAALREFLEHGLGGATTRRIASRAGMAQATLFHHFEGKQAIHDELVEIGAAKVAFDSDSMRGDPLGGLNRVVDEALQMLRDHPPAALMFLFMSRASSQGSPRAQASAEALLVSTESLLTEGQRRGEIRPGNPRALAIALWGAVQGTAEILLANPTEPLPETSWLLDIVRA